MYCPPPIPPSRVGNGMRPAHSHSTHRRVATLIGLALLCAVAGAFALVQAAHAPAPSPWSTGPRVAAEKPRAQVDARPETPEANRSKRPLPGETVDDPIWLSEYPPFYITDNSCYFLDDYDEACPYTGSTSPDVVYAFSPTQDQVLHVDLCASEYDTKVYIYEDVVTPGAPYACNDDACGSDGYKSRLDYVTFSTGHTYYIVVDGYGGDCGEYTLSINYTWECVWCTETAIHEDEPDCYNGYVDLHNAGCGGDPPVFQSIAPSEEPMIEICGRTGTFITDGYHMRDTDWYEIILTEPREILVEANTNFYGLLMLLDGRDGCEGLQTIDFDSQPMCVVLNVGAELDPGRYWIWIGPSEFDGVFCGTEYQFFLHGHTPGMSALPERQPPPATLSLLPVQPSPCLDEARIRFALAAPAAVTLEILDPAGRVIATPLAARSCTAGMHAVTWRPVAASGAGCSGLYFCRARSAQGNQTRRFVRIE